MTELDIFNLNSKAFQKKISKNLNEFYHTRLYEAYDEAINEITKDASIKIKAAIDDGNNRVILYTFQFNNFSEVKNVEFDKNGIKIRFGDNVALHRMLSQTNFYQKLSNYLNCLLESASYHSYSKRNKDDGSWNIYAYWGLKTQDNIQDITHFNIASDEAIAEITKEVDIKIKNAVNEDKYLAILYTFYVNDDEFDKNGTKIRFGNNVFLTNMIMKRPWKSIFFKKLLRNLNMSVDKPIHSKWYSVSYFVDKETGSFNIYSSWKRR